MQSSFPQILDMKKISIAVDGWFEWVVANYGDDLERFFLPILRALNGIEAILLWLPWYFVIFLIGLAAWLVSRDMKLSLGCGFLVFLLGVLGLWDPAMSTVALMLTSTMVAVVIGIPVGILLSRSDRAQAFILPILDIMQTLPIFVYLIPFVMLLGPGKIPAVLATIVFAVPPVIRLTDLGIRQVDREVVEAVTAFGATPSQKLFSVQIPLAMPTIMAGINQTTMMALSMVVIASMIGAGGLGYQVLQGIQRLEVSRGFVAGMGIVFLAVVFDRIVQAQGRRLQQHLHTERE
jgi:glycine betaine/proline transport system permease protein